MLICIYLYRLMENSCRLSGL